VSPLGPPDSLVAVGAVHTGALAGVSAAVERWHEFYLLAGTAAVTLVGLLFVALSFHLDTLLQDHKAHLLGAARLAFLSFLYVMMMSLAFLVPALNPRFLAVFVLVLPLVLLVNTVWAVVRHTRRHDPHGHDRFLRRRYAITGLIAGIAITSAWAFLRVPAPRELLNFAVPVGLMLVNAAGISWDLLVQVGRSKLAQERPGRA